MLTSTVAQPGLVAEQIIIMSQYSLVALSFMYHTSSGGTAAAPGGTGLPPSNPPTTNWTSGVAEDGDTSVQSSFRMAQVAFKLCQSTFSAAQREACRKQILGRIKESVNGKIPWLESSQWKALRYQNAQQPTTPLPSSMKDADTWRKVATYEAGRINDHAVLFFCLLVSLLVLLSCCLMSKALVRAGSEARMRAAAGAGHLASPSQPVRQGGGNGVSGHFDCEGSLGNAIPSYEEAVKPTSPPPPYSEVVGNGSRSNDT